MAVIKNGCIMLDFEKVHFSTLVAMLDIDDTYLTGDGVEQTPHVTLIYGIDMDKYNTPEDLNYIKTEIEESGIMHCTFDAHEISTFSNDERDVLKLDFLESKTLSILRDLNRKFTEKFNVVSDFDEYHPHTTIAYLQSKMGKEFNQTLSNVYPFSIKKAVLSYPTSKENADKEIYERLELATNRDIIARDFVRRNLF